MKTIKYLVLSVFALLAIANTASADVYYSYNQGYQPNYYTPGCSSCGNNYYQPSSYSYTQGCYTYYYNGYTRTTSITSYNCATNQYSYYVAPVTTYYTSPYYTYGYSDGSWYPSNYYYNNNNYYNNGYNGYQYGFVYTPRVNCNYWNSYLCQ